MVLRSWNCLLSAAVYVTGRTVTPGSYPLPGTVGESAWFVPLSSQRNFHCQN
jgi:hypothetical protein